MIEDCYIIDGVLASTLQCYYNRTCFALLHPHLSRSVEILSSRADDNLYPHQTVQSLVDRLMVNHFSVHINFKTFYQQCKPFRCSYSFQHRFDFLFIAGTVLGVFGGLSLILRYIAKFIARRMVPLHTERIFHTNVHPLKRLDLFFRHHVAKRLINLNLFRSNGVADGREGRLHTRLFLSVLLASTISIGVYLVISEESQVINVPSPLSRAWENVDLPMLTLFTRISNADQCDVQPPSDMFQ